MYPVLEYVIIHINIEFYKELMYMFGIRFNCQRKSCPSGVHVGLTIQEIFLHSDLISKQRDMLPHHMAGQAVPTFVSCHVDSTQVPFKINHMYAVSSH